MKKNELEKLKMNLQYFAEEDPSDQEDSGTQENDGDEEGDEGSEKLLTEEEVQARIDDAVKSRLARKEKEFQDKLKKEKEKAKADAEKYARMSQEEKEQAEIQERIKELEEREKELNDRELLTNIKADLTDKNLPVAFADYLLEMQDVELIKTSIEEIKGVWDEEISEFKKASVRQSNPKDSDVSFRGKKKDQSKSDFFNEGRKI